MNFRGPTFVLAFVLSSACTHQSAYEKEDKGSIGAELFDQNGSAESIRIMSEYVARMEEQLPLIEAIAKLSARDQFVRQAIAKIDDHPNLTTEEESALKTVRARYMSEIDETNTRELKALLESISWRDLANAGGDLFIKAFFVVQHSPDYAFQAEVLAELQPLASEGLIDTQQYAYLYDRVQLRSDELQLYGTQLKCVEGEYGVFDLRAPEFVDDRRLEMGLQPLSEYVAFVRGHSGSC